MKNFRTYQMALELLRASKPVTPTLKNPYRDQFERAVLSIPLNLAEGSAKTSNKERKKFYETALGSLREVQAIVEVLELKSLDRLTDQLGACIYTLCNSLRR